jgi:hypothetical protein
MSAAASIAVPRDDGQPGSPGIFDRVKRFFVGAKPAVLKEERVRVHWLSLAYMVVMSVFALQVFALQDFQTAFNPGAALADRVQSGLLVGVIVVAVFISDYAAPHARELAKLVALRGEAGLAWSLRFYALCVYGTDGYAVITILYRSVAHLPATTPPPAIGPLSGDWTEVLIRGMLIVFTGWMIHTVTQKQYPTSNTLARRGAEIMGGVLLGRLANQKAGHVAMSTVAQWFRAFTEAAKRQPRFNFPRLPFVSDPTAAEKAQWDQLVEVFEKVERHPASGVATEDPDANRPLQDATSPHLRDLPPALSDEYLTLIAGIAATLIVQLPGGDPTPAHIAAEAQRLGYVAPRQADIEIALIRLAEGAGTPAATAPRALPGADTDAFVNLIDEVRTAITEFGAQPSVAAIIAELEDQGYAHAADTDVAHALVVLGDRIRQRTQMQTSTAPGNGQRRTDNPARPKPGSIAYANYIHKEALALVSRPAFQVSFVNIADALQEPVDDVIAALWMRQKPRRNRRADGKTVKPDAVLDRLDFSEQIAAEAQPQALRS